MGGWQIQNHISMSAIIQRRAGIAKKSHRDDCCSPEVSGIKADCSV